MAAANTRTIARGRCFAWLVIILMRKGCIARARHRRERQRLFFSGSRTTAQDEVPTRPPGRVLPWGPNLQVTPARRHKDRSRGKRGAVIMPGMCRLLGVVSSEATDYGFSLCRAPRSLALLSRDHPDGWGLAIHAEGRGWDH